MKDSEHSQLNAPKRVRYLGQTSPLELTKNRVYDVISVERGWYRMIDDTGEDYLYPPAQFEIVE